MSVALKKLDWLNGAYIRALSPTELTERILGHARETGQLDATLEQAAIIGKAVPLIQERLVTLSEAVGKLDYLLGERRVEDAARASLPANAAEVLDAAVAALSAVPDFTSGEIQAALRAALVEGLGLKPKLAFGPVRVAITGKTVSPPLFESMEILGSAESLARLDDLRSML